MEPDSSEKVGIPANFEDAPVEDLIQLIGELSYHPLTLLVIVADTTKPYSRYARPINVA
jgi:hypothetical protein